jgi:ParB family chromosome partitioning protein
MSEKTINSTDDTTKAQFLAPGTHQTADAKGNAKDEHQNTAAVSEASVDVDAVVSDGLVLIPLSRLVISQFNVRKSGGEDVVELAALIKAQGLLQNLIVHPEQTKRGKATGDYGVAAGGRRLRALRLLAKAGEIAKDKGVLCRLITREAAIATSVAENSGRAAMSVADTVTAFSEMIASGAGVEDTALCFGISPLTVRRRLKLANVSPVLFEMFRQDEINLDQLMALAITDDHVAQERAWNALPSYSRHASSLRRVLLGQGIDAAGDPLVKFVGIPVYENAGGVVVRDLFQDTSLGYVMDVELLQRLALERLNDVADALKTEGWAWVEARTSFDYSERQSFGTASMSHREATPAHQAEVIALTAARALLNDALEDLYDVENGDDAGSFDQAKVDQSEAEVEAIDDKLERLRSDLCEWTADVMAYAGVVVALDREGKLCVHRGLLKTEDRKRSAKIEAGSEEWPAVQEVSANPESLVRRLTAHKTKALQLLLSNNIQVALAALTHTLVQQVITERAGRTISTLGVRAQHCDDVLRAAADDIEASRAWVELASRLDNWRERIPGDADRLLPWLIAQPQDTLLEILALCSALSVNVTSGREADSVGDALAAAVELDMADWWTPTAESYLKHVPKARIVEAVSEAITDEDAGPLSKLKKGEAVAAAEALLHGTRWLPSPLRARSV